MEHQGLEQLELIVTQDFHFNQLFGIYETLSIPYQCQNSSSAPANTDEVVYK